MEAAVWVVKKTATHIRPTSGKALHDAGRHAGSLRSLTADWALLFAATFGNVHGAYKPGAVQLKPTILSDGQKAVMDKHGAETEMDLVFHGDSGSELSEIRETLDYGVVKMNIDTDTQYAFTRPIVTRIGENIEGC